jgi:hypothetical protein
MYNKIIKSISMIFALGLLSTCGGGGGGGVVDNVTYTGSTTPAVIVDTNAKTLAEGAITGSTTGIAFGVVSEEQEVQPNPTILDVARILSNSVTQLDISPSASTLPGAIVSDSGSDSCLDGGSISFNLSVDDVTGDFSGTFNFINCAEGGTTINGNATVSGSLGGADFVISFTFNPITVVSGTESYTMSGTVGTSVLIAAVPPVTVSISMDVRLRNNNTQMVEWVNNLTISAVDNISFLEMTITGRYYHPEHGYIDIVTNTAFQINVADQWPNVGQMTITGASGSKARLTATSNTEYTLEVDADGDDTYETVTLENWG